MKIAHLVLVGFVRACIWIVLIAALMKAMGIPVRIEIIWLCIFSGWINRLLELALPGKVSRRRS
ncbi:MAG TPA: hypothetical protein PKD55_16735 [Bellilinea sp.]|nr:hypothetical protein [Bellilinea sp.]